MERIKKILVPSDFSAHSGEALQFAADLARHYSASIDLIHVFDTLTYALPEGYVIPSADELDRMLKQCQVQLDEERRGALELGAGAVETAVLQGGSVPEIIQFAKEHGSDLIVMGTHGRTGFKHFLIGSVAERVVRTAPCAVLTVRGKD